MKKVGILYDNISGNTGDVAIGLSIKKILRDIGVDFDELVPGNFNPYDYEHIIIGGGHLLRPTPDFFYDKFKIPGNYVLNAMGIVDNPTDLHYLNDYAYLTVRSSGDKKKISYLQKNVQVIPCTTMLLKDLEGFPLSPKKPSLGIHLFSNFFSREEEVMFTKWASELPYNIYFIPITHYSHDNVYLEKLSSKIKNSEVLPILKPLEIFTFIGRLDYFISCSLHGAIFSYVHNVPFLLVDQEKMRFFMEDRGLQKYLFKNFNNIKDLFDIVLDKKPDYSQKISNDMYTLQRHIDNLKDILPIHQSVSVIEKKDNQTNFQIYYLQSQFIGLHSKINELNIDLTAKNSKIDSLNNKIEELNIDLTAKNSKIDSLNNKIEELNIDLTAKNSKIDEFNNALQLKDNHARSLEFEIQSIYQSIIWQSVCKYQKIIDKLLPHGTKRRSHYDLVLIGSRIISNEGWRNFLIKFNKRITSRPNRKLSNSGHIFDSYCRDNVQMAKERVKKFKYMHKISIIMPVYNTGHIWLTKALDSVISQLYENWELCIVDDASTDNNIRKILENYAKKDIRIIVKYLDKNKGISGSSNEAISLATGEFVVLMDHDDELTNDALYEVAKILNEHIDTDIIYSDSDKIDDKGNRFDFEFKPDWSPELLLSYCYFSHVKVLRKTLIEKIGGFREGFEGSQDYDLVLRAVEKTDNIYHIPKILYHWRSIPGSVAYSADEKPLSIEKGRKAVEDALIRRKIHGDAIVPKFAEKNKLGIYKINFRLKEKPKISIIIPTKDKLNLLKRCIDSIENKTTYENYEIIIADTGSIEKETLEYLSETKHKVLHIVQDKFNFSRINNHAVSSVNTEFVLLLNNDTEVIAEDWLEEMLGYMMSDPKIGAVGAKLIYKDERVQHAGVVLGLNNGLAGHANKLTHCDDGGYLNYGLVSRNYSAVTAACLLTRKKYYEEVLGLDEDNFSVAYNDVDFCLKLIQKGYRVVLNPYALLYHHEGSSRGTGKGNDSPTEENSLRKKWGYLINKGDRYYNPHLSLRDENFRIENMEDSIVGNKNLLFISHNLNFEGAPYIQCHLAKELKNMGYSITVISPLDGPLKDYYLDMGIRVNTLRASLDDENNKKAFISWIRSERFELAHINTIVNFQLVDLISGVIPVIWAIHESEREHYFSTIGKLEEKSFKNVDQVVFVSNATRKVYSDLEYNGNFCTIYNGINITDIESFKQKNNKSDLRKKHGFSDDCKIVTVVGTTCERKGQKIFTEAAIKLLKNVHNDNIHFLITSAIEGSYLDHLEHMIKNNNVSANIHIIFKTENIFDYYLMSDIFVCSSFIESLPTVILEAMAFELPIISTNVFGIREEIEDGKSGILIEPGDSNLLAEKIKLLLENEKISLEFAKNAYVRVINEFSLEKMVDEYQKLVDMLTEKNKSLR